MILMAPCSSNLLSNHAETAGKAALRRTERFESSSDLAIPDGRGDVEALTWSDVDLGQCIGEGAFSYVHEATLSRENEGPTTRYAIKLLKEDIKETEDSFVTAAVDLALEAQLLAKLMHPNIIRLHGFMAGCVSESFKDGNGFFLVLDLMVDTLDSKLSRWRRDKKASSIFTRASSNTVKALQQNGRIEQVALGLAEGLAYLHSRNIIYRDLKAHNVGFDEHGVVRIFDFGLAREAHSQGTIRHATGNAGTPRYMAPEVAKNESYGFPSDVYSYSILFWEILTLDRPFESIKSVAQFNEEVVRGKSRPSLKKVSSPELKALLAKSWHDDQNERPDFVTVCQTLRQHLYQSHSPAKHKRFLSSLHSTMSTMGSSMTRGTLTESGHHSRGTADHQAAKSTTSLVRQDSVGPIPRMFIRGKSQAPSTAAAANRSYGELNWFRRNILRQSALEIHESRRGHQGALDSRRSWNSNDSVSSRRLSGLSDRSNCAMGEILAAEVKSNRKILRHMKARSVRKHDQSQHSNADSEVSC